MLAKMWDVELRTPDQDLNIGNDRSFVEHSKVSRSFRRDLTKSNALANYNVLALVSQFALHGNRSYMAL